MKYLVEEWGVDKFRAKVEEYFGQKIAPSKPLPQWKYLDFLGWQQQGDGKLFLGLAVQNGRIKDEGDFKLKSALKRIVERFNVPIMLTPSQDLVLFDIDPADKSKIQGILDRAKVARSTKIDPLTRYSMACPALPTCGLATTEAERVSPSILARVRSLLDKVGLPNEHFFLRMTGCPNGCARPYLAELGLVGNGPNTYQVWMGAAPNQTRLAKVYLEKLNIDDLETVLEPVFIYFKKERQLGESFGDFCDRVGLDAIHQFASTY